MSLSCVRLFETPRTVACQAPLSMGFSRQEDWSGLPCPPLGGLPNPGIGPRSPTLQTDSLPSEPPRKHSCVPQMYESIGLHCPSSSRRKQVGSQQENKNTRDDSSKANLMQGRCTEVWTSWRTKSRCRELRSQQEQPCDHQHLIWGKAPTLSSLETMKHFLPSRQNLPWSRLYLQFGIFVFQFEILLFYIRKSLEWIKETGDHIRNPVSPTSKFNKCSHISVLALHLFYFQRHWPSSVSVTFPRTEGKHRSGADGVSRYAFHTFTNCWWAYDQI